MRDILTTHLLVQWVGGMVPEELLLSTSSAAAALNQLRHCPCEGGRDAGKVAKQGQARERAGEGGQDRRQQARL